MRRFDSLLSRFSATLVAASLLIVLLLGATVPGAAQAKASAHQSRSAAKAHKKAKHAAAKSKSNKTTKTTKTTVKPVTRPVSASTPTAASSAGAPVTTAAAPAQTAVASAASTASSATSAAAPAISSTPIALPQDLAPSAASASNTAGAVAQFNRVTFEYSSDLSNADEGSRYQFMVMQATDASQIQALKAAHPGVKVILYQEPFLARESDPSGLTVCTNYQNLQSNDLSWMLHDQNGQIIQAPNDPGNYLMDVGSAAYQQSCVAHAIALAKRVGADGVMFDDVNAALSWYLAPGTTVSQYPSAASWQDAEASFLSYATSQLHAAGLVSIANVGGASAFPGLWQRWGSLVDGSMEQGFNNWGNGASEVSNHWQALESEEAWSEANHKYTLLQATDNGESQNTFGLASMMLAAGGMTSYCTANVNFTSDEQWYGSYAAAQQLGAPQGGYTQLSDGLYERSFANGIVVVNPSQSGSGNLVLPEAMKDSSTGQSESTLTAAPMTGYILTTN